MIPDVQMQPGSGVIDNRFRALVTVVIHHDDGIAEATFGFLIVNMLKQAFKKSRALECDYADRYMHQLREKIFPACLRR